MNRLLDAKSGFRRAVLVVAVATGAMLYAGTALAHQADGCSDETLKGTYGLRVSGEVLEGSSSTVVQFKDGVDLATFDGKGNFSQEDFVLSNGALMTEQPTNPDGFNDGESGPYMVNPDCTGTFTINETASRVVIIAMFVLTNGGQTMHAIVSSLTITTPGGRVTPNASIHADGERQ